MTSSGNKQSEMKVSNSFKVSVRVNTAVRVVLDTQKGRAMQIIIHLLNTFTALLQIPSTLYINNWTK